MGVPTRRQNTTVGTGGGAGQAGPTQARVAAFGDSLMWGQGLDRSDRFSQLIVRAAGGILGKQSGRLSADASRSGAKIRTRGSDRSGFVDTFPALFQTQTQQRNFMKGTDESPASGLYGEVPATFPTVRGQIDMVSDALGRTIDIALVDGGVNDVEVENIVNPAVAGGAFVEEFDGTIRDIAHDDVLELLGRVRRKCPKAYILYFGFFAPLSYSSSPSQLRALFKYETDDNIGWFFNGIFGCVDVNAAILEGMTRSEWFAGRWQYWTRRAVDDANHDESLRGPGILFVPSGFQPANSAFAPRPFLHEDYTDPTSDPAQARRRREIPRINQLAAMEQMYDRATTPVGASSPPPPTATAVQTLHDAIVGPVPLLTAMEDYIADRSTDNRVRMLEALRSEVLRIRRALVASVSHPNAAGARSYADMAIARLRAHRTSVDRALQEQRAGPPPGPGPGTTLDATLRRYGLRSPGPILADIGHLDVDSFAVRVVTAANSRQNFFPNVWLIVNVVEANGRPGSREYLLNFPYSSQTVAPPAPATGPGITVMSKVYTHFEPGSTHRFTTITGGQLRLDQITGCHLLVGDDPFVGKRAGGSPGRLWRPQEVRLEVNSQEVASVFLIGQTFTFNDTVDLGYPTPQPGFVAPQVAEVAMPNVRNLGQRSQAQRALAARRAVAPAAKG